MTRQELANELKLKDSYVGNHWTRIKASHEKMGIHLYKRGRGEKAEHGIRYFDEEKVRWSPLG